MAESRIIQVGNKLRLFIDPKIVKREHSMTVKGYNVKVTERETYGNLVFKKILELIAFLIIGLVLVAFIIYDNCKRYGLF